MPALAMQQAKQTSFEVMLASQWPACGIFLGPRACDAPVRLAVD
jgi:hypothetical protein